MCFLSQGGGRRAGNRGSEGAKWRRGKDRGNYILTTRASAMRAESAAGGTAERISSASAAAEGYSRWRRLPFAWGKAEE